MTSSDGRNRAVSALLGAALFVMPRVAASQVDSFGPRAQEALRRTAAPWVARRFELVDSTRFGVLLERERDSLALRLEHGWEYIVLGVCDEDCTDLYFYLIDPQDKQVAVAVSSESRPFIRFKPVSEGGYTLVVAMGKCNVPPCYYGVRVYRKVADP